MLCRFREVARWNPVPAETLEADGQDLYNSFDPNNRSVVDLATLDLVDEDGNEINVYDEDGYRVPRRKPLHSRNTPSCGVLMDLTKVRHLFKTAPESFVRQDEETIDQDIPDKPLKINVYPQAFTRQFGHFQSNSVPDGFHHLFNTINRTLAANANDDQPVIQPFGLQGYNHVQHNLTERSGRLEVVQGRITSTLSGTRSKTASASRTFNKQKASLMSHLPHEHVEQKLSKQEISRGFRLEIVVTIDVSALRRSSQSGGWAQYHMSRFHHLTKLCIKSPTVKY
jgi:hypothetical protein